MNDGDAAGERGGSCLFRPPMQRIYGVEAWTKTPTILQPQSPPMPSPLTVPHHHPADDGSSFPNPNHTKTNDEHHQRGWSLPPSPTPPRTPTAASATRSLGRDDMEPTAACANVPHLHPHSHLLASSRSNTYQLPSHRNKRSWHKKERLQRRVPILPIDRQYCR